MLGTAIGQVLPLAVAVALSPLPILAVVLILATPRAATNGPAFVAGWLTGLALVGTIVLLVSDGGDTDGEGPAWVSGMKLGLGALLVLFAAHQWRGRTGARGTPRWLLAIDALTPARALGLAIVLSAINPKNLLLAVAAAAEIAHLGLGGAQQAAALVAFLGIAAAGVTAPVVIYFALGRRSRALLKRLRSALAAGSAVVAVLLLVVGVKLIAEGVAGL